MANKLLAAVKAIPKAEPRTWFSKLSAETRRDLLEIKEKHGKGEIDCTSTDIWRELKKLGVKVPTRCHFTRWFNGD